MAHISGQTGENTKGNGRTIKCMALVFLSGLMAENMKGNILMIKKKAKALLNGNYNVS